MLQLELKLAQEKLVGLEERLERQRKVNSQKKAKLKLKQDGLEAVSLVDLPSDWKLFE